MIAIQVNTKGNPAGSVDDIHVVRSLKGGCSMNAQVAKVIDNNRHCGTVALSSVTGCEVEGVVAYFQRTKAVSWKGRLYWRELLQYIRDLPGGPKFKQLTRAVMGATLERFIDQHTVRDTTYLVRVGGHFLSVRNGHCIDQYQERDITEHWCARKRVSHAIKILECK